MDYISQKLEEFETKILSKLENSKLFSNPDKKTVSIISFIILLLVVTVLLVLYFTVFR